MTTSVAVHQPTFLPWVGFFNKFAMADVFIILGGVDYDKADYMNRCRVNGAWVTLPHVRRGSGRAISEVEYIDARQINRAIKTLDQTIGSKKNIWRHRADEVFEILRGIKPGDSLLHTNFYLIQAMAKAAGFCAQIVIDNTSSDTPESKTQRLMRIIGQHVKGPVTYYAGRAGKDYLEPSEVPAGYSILTPTIHPSVKSQTFLVDLVRENDPRQHTANSMFWTPFVSS